MLVFLLQLDVFGAENCGLFVFRLKVKLFALSAAILDQYCKFPMTIRILLSDTMTIKGIVCPECNFCHYLLTLTVFCPKITKMHHKYTMEVVHMMNALYFKSSECI